MNEKAMARAAFEFLIVYGAGGAGALRSEVQSRAWTKLRTAAGLAQSKKNAKRSKARAAERVEKFGPLPSAEARRFFARVESAIARGIVDAFTGKDRAA